MFLRLLFSFTMLLCLHFAYSQPRPPYITSPQINPGNTVTFRYNAPSAKQVNLSAQFLKSPAAMSKDTQGVWSVTVGPVKPDIYPYSFHVDGITVMDPSNAEFFPNERFKASLVDVPADTPMLHAIQDVPHGKITYDYYPSIGGTTGTVVIYTPPGYDKETSKKYPVFYLISGTTDTEETFYKVGRVNWILDNLIARGKAKPMVIVMPYGNIQGRIAQQKYTARPADLTGRESEEALRRSGEFEKDLLDNIIPYVEKNYRALANRDNRAIGGFSRGGGQTLRAAFGNMDKFSWICCYSSYLSSQEIENRYKTVIDNAANTNKRLKLFWISVGNEDFLYAQTAEFMKYLQAKNVNFKSLVTGGGHTWMNVRHYFAETAVLLFR
jgi:enterochelin esterase-like enzyme